MKRYTWTILAIWMIHGISLFAGDPEFTASAPAAVKAGQQFQYTIQGNVQGDVELPDMPGFEYRGGPFTSYSSSTQWVNGKMTATTTASYTYVFVATTTGEFTIPPAMVKVKRDNYSTNSVKIAVTDGSQQSGQVTNTGGQQVSSQPATTISENNPEVFLKIIPSKTSVYVGEQFVSELKIYTRVTTRPAANLKDVPYEGFYKHRLDPDQSATRERIQGIDYVTQVLQRHVLIPQKSGRMVIEPFDSEWTVPRKVNRNRSGNALDDFFNDPFNDPFFDRYTNVPVTISTDPVTINVKPLPGNAPGGFTGAVGDFSMKASLSEDHVKVNDAINLKIIISGTGNISLLGEPRVSFPPDHDVYETNKAVDIKTSGNRVSGTVTFDYPLVARHAGNYRIPPVKFTWFDPAAGTYRTASSGEFNFTVEKGDNDTSQGGVVIPGTTAETVGNLGEDILDISRKVPDFTKRGVSPAGSALYWIIYPLLFIGFLVSLLLLGRYYKRKADMRLTRNRKASKMAKNRLKAADRARKNNLTEPFFEETEKAIWGYLADKLGLELSELSREKVTEILSRQGIEGKETEEMFRIIDDCEFSRYAPSSEKSDMNRLYDDAVRLIRNLEQTIRK